MTSVRQMSSTLCQPIACIISYDAHAEINFNFLPTFYYYSTQRSFPLNCEVLKVLLSK